MPVFSANLNFLFNEVPFMERFAAASKAGFKQVEFMFPYDYDQNEVKSQLAENNVKLVLFNLPAGNWAEGDRGLAADPARKQEFLEGVGKAVRAAELLGVKRINCLVGKVTGDYGQEEIMANLLDNIGYAADEFQKAGLSLLLEPINHFDIPGFYLNTTEQVMEIINKLGRANIFLQYDIYHAEREGEEHGMIVGKYLPNIGHIQVADNPGRNEPGTGIIKITELLGMIDQLGYDGYIGMEYKPSTTTPESLRWVEQEGYVL